MANLAADTDLEARLGRSLTTAEDARVAALLADASALIRGYTGQTFTAVDNGTVILRPIGAYLVLPQLPVQAVGEVVGVLADGTLSDPIVGWTWDGLDRIDITTAGWPGDAWWPWPSGPDAYQVTYDYGDSTVPADVVAVCCAMVLRVLTAPSQVEGMSSEHIGQYSYQMSQQVNGGSPGVSVKLTELDKSALSHYRPHAGSIQVRL